MKLNTKEIKLGPFWVLAEAKGEKLVRTSFSYPPAKAPPARTKWRAGKKEGSFKKESPLISRVNVSGANKGKTTNSSLILERLEEDLSNYWRGEKINFSEYPLKLDNYSTFSKKVWILTREIPYGEVRSYKWIAEKVHTKGYRAVGAALARNPFSIIIPCHRVVREDGSLGGYSPGLEIKKKLLQMEGA